MHPSCWKSFSPCDARDPSAFPLVSHASQCSGFRPRTCTKKICHCESERIPRPGGFEQRGTVDLLGFAARCSLVLDNEEENKRGNEQRKEGRDRHQKQVERVYVFSDR